MISLGKDGVGNEIYALSVKGERGMVYRLVDSFLAIYRIPEGELSVIDSGIRESWFLVAGRFFCGFDFLVPLGRFFASIGMKKTYGRLAEVVRDVQAALVNLP